MKTVDVFKKFMEDEHAWDMYVTGPAGTGKTTDLRASVEYCMENDIPYAVCAYTHKACGILQEKLPQGAVVTTLWSLLRKRPGINQHATRLQHIDIAVQSGKMERPRVIFIDEYSMIGEKDGIDIRAAQDPEYEGDPAMKVVWLGDNNQLPPVGDIPFVQPKGDYCVTLTKIWRNDNELQKPLNELIDMINGSPIKPLTTNDRFIRELDIVEEYERSLQGGHDAVMLAYTNKRVQELNSLVQGRTEPEKGDWLFSPTTQQRYLFHEWVNAPEMINTPYSGDIPLNTKFKTLEHLIDTEACRFARVEDEESNELILAVEFGHYEFKMKKQELKQLAAASNADIETKFRGYKAAGWAKFNPTHKLARKRAKAWRDFLTYDECVVCLDFTHATTVHKSQGSTYDIVILDTEDIGLCAQTNVMMYLKLFYVGISRARSLVLTN